MVRTLDRARTRTGPGEWPGQGPRERVRAVPRGLGRAGLEQSQGRARAGLHWGRPVIWLAEQRQAHS